VDEEGFPGQGLVAIGLADERGDFFGFDEPADGHVGDDLVQRGLVHALDHVGAHVAGGHGYAADLAGEPAAEELGGDEGLLVASKIADQLGITRSVIVNALRKFESAGVIESRSLGMKGTYIKVLNPYLLEYLAKKTKVFQK